MDPDRFDALVRLLARTGSRRRLLAGALAAPLGPLAATAAKPPAAARHRSSHRPDPARKTCLPIGRRCTPPTAEQAAGQHRHADRRQGRGHGHHHAPSCAHCCSRFGQAGADGKARCACQAAGAACSDPAACCGGACRAGQCTSCPDALTSCAGQCVDLQTDDQHCGACGTVCLAGQRCQHGQCGCDGQSCPHGCCDARQTCQAGTSDLACGGGGAACQPCGACATCAGATCVAAAGCCGDAAVCQNGVCTPCAAGQRCQNGQCGCDPGFHRCNGGCVRDADVAHCGASCEPCPSSVCSPATCDGRRCGRAPIAGCCEQDAACGDTNGCTTDTCDPNTHTCVHTPNDGTACGEGGVCCGGSCCMAPANASPTCVGETCGFACKAGFHVCDGACVDDASIDQCGAGCVACPRDPNGTATCAGGQCGLTCDAGFHVCNGACVADDDVAHCGAACDPCPTDPNGTATCAGGQCGITCKTGFHPCNGACVRDDDATRCGAACVACPSPTDPNAQATCVNGECGTACKTGFALCDGGCVNLQNTNEHCGSCGNSCSSLGIDGAVCRNGACCQFQFKTCSSKLPCCAGLGTCTGNRCCFASVGSCVQDSMCCSGTCNSNHTCK